MNNLNDGEVEEEDTPEGRGPDQRPGCLPNTTITFSTPEALRTPYLYFEPYKSTRPAVALLFRSIRTAMRCWLSGI